MEEHFLIRDLEPGDESTLRELARNFTDDPNSHAVEHWSVDLSTDFGRLAYDPSDSDPVGAAWYRSETYVMSGDRRRGALGSRELFVSIIPRVRRRGLASRLLDEVIEHATNDHGIDVLVVLPAHPGAVEMPRSLLPGGQPG